MIIKLLSNIHFLSNIELLMRYLNEGFKYVTGTPSAFHLNMYTKSQLKKGITSPQKPSKAQVVLPSLAINRLA